MIQSTQSNSLGWLLVALLSGMISLVIGAAILELPDQGVGLRDVVQSHLPESGVGHPVTAVLMNFRGYDTLLELTVLVLAVLGARVLAASGECGPEIGVPLQSPLLDGFIRLTIPVMLVMAGYLLWAGGHAPGGAFQAGALLAALGILTLLGGHDWTHRLSERGERLLFVLGGATFLLAGVASLGAGGTFLEFSRVGGKWQILAVEVASTVSIAAILTALFTGGRLAPRADDLARGATQLASPREPQHD